MKQKFIWAGAGAVAVIVVASLMAVRGKGEDLLEVETAVIERETIVQTVNATGRIQPKTQIRISADVSSKIMALHVDEGDWVEAGTLLVELDRERFEAAVENAQARVRSAQANACEP